MIGDLGLARRSGALVMGFDNVLRALDGPKAPPNLLIEASDGSKDGKRKLYNAAHARELKPLSWKASPARNWAWRWGARM